MTKFDPSELKKLYRSPENSNGEDNGQITIIGGSTLFHGAPVLALKAASRVVDMVFFASPERSIQDIAAHIKSSLSSFIWIPFEEVEEYIEKSDAVLIGPGFMRYEAETAHETIKDTHAKTLDNAGEFTRNLTQKLLAQFPDKKWVVDAGSLQVIDPEWLPKKSIITPNKKEFCRLFDIKPEDIDHTEIEQTVETYAAQYNIVISYKAPVGIVSDGRQTVMIEGGNAGLTKGGTGDILAGLSTALLAKNDPFLAASAAVYIEKKTAENLAQSVGMHFNADDISENIFKTLHAQTASLHNTSERKN